jgi:hypothetical protein
MKPTKEQIEAVAEWWAVRTFDKVFNQNNGDNSPNGGIGFLLANTAAMQAREKTGVEARLNFKVEIVKHLESVTDFYEMQLDVDYNPNLPLHDICVRSGVDTGMLPCKTFTLWDRQENCFRGRYQYGGPWETIG